MKSKIEIINETVEFYSNNPRSLNKDGKCKYLSENGDKCAFGRCLTEEGLKLVSENFEGSNATGCIHGVDWKDIRGLGENILKEEYRGHKSYFWDNIQSLHDADRHWKDGKLTEFGQRRVEELKELYKN